MAKKGSGLTPKQQHFCRAIASGCTMSDAYREAYSTSRMKPATIHREATRLMSNPMITTRIEVLNRAKDRAMVASAVSDKDRVLTKLRGHMENATNEDNAKIRATELLGRTVPGLFKGEEPAEVQRSAQEIRDDIDKRLDAIEARHKAAQDEDQDAEEDQPGPALKAV